MYKIVKMIMERNFQPVIIFSFSKKECEAYALQVSKLDFNTGITGELVFLSARVHTHTATLDHQELQYFINFIFLY